MCEFDGRLHTHENDEEKNEKKTTVRKKKKKFDLWAHASYIFLVLFLFVHVGKVVIHHRFQDNNNHVGQHGEIMSHVA